MKYGIVLPDGAADEPLEELGGRTVLEVAHKPHMDWIAANGRQGLVVTVPSGYTPGSDVATLSVLGYDPAACYSGRAPLEAAARNIALGPQDIVFRCNLVTIANRKMEDFTAGHISQAEAARLITDMNALFPGEGLEFHVGVQYRHLLVVRGGANLVCQCTPPHDILDQEVQGYLPSGPGAARPRAIMAKVAEFLAGHEVNAVRRDLGENPASDIWLWGQGQTRKLPSMTDRFGLRSACVAAVDLVRGITRLIGFDLVDVPGATGFLDTNYAGKGAAAAAALADYDLVVVHVEAPDEAGHLGDCRKKIYAIEQVDAHVVGPLLERLRTFRDWKVLVVPDHPTPVRKRTHTADPPPFCLAGSGVSAAQGLPYGESHAAQSDLRISPGHELMEYFLRSQARPKA